MNLLYHVEFDQDAALSKWPMCDRQSVTDQQSDGLQELLEWLFATKNYYFFFTTPAPQVPEAFQTKCVILSM